MWNERLKRILKEKGFTQEDVAEFTSIKKDGFHLALNRETLKFSDMLKIANKLDINLNQFKQIDKKNNVSEPDEKHNINVKDSVQIELENNKLILQYEERIKDLQGQVQFLQSIIDRQSTQGAKSA